MRSNKSTIILSLSIIAFSGFNFSCAQSTKITTERNALVIGISNYKNLPSLPHSPPSDLAYPKADAESIKTLLADQDPTWNVYTPLIDLTATKSAIKNAVETYFIDASPDSTALIYFSGHGYYDDKDGKAYLVATDYDPSDPQPSLISPEELYSWISNNIPTKNVIFISDSCFSGAFISATDSHDTINSPYDPQTDATVSTPSLAALSNFGTLLVMNAKESGKLAPIAISAAGSEESSYDGTDAQGHGVFTYYLLQSAEINAVDGRLNGDTNGDGYVTCTEAYTYAAKAVDRSWNSIYKWDGFYPHISGGLRDLVLFTDD